MPWIALLSTANFEQVKKHSHFANFEQVKIIIHFPNVEQVIIISHFANFEQVKKQSFLLTLNNS